MIKIFQFVALFLFLFTGFNVSPVNAQQSIDIICARATTDNACRIMIQQHCITRIPDCTTATIAQLDAEGGWDPAAGMTVAAANAANAALVGSYTALPGCATGSTYLSCLQEIGNFCRFDPTDPGCGTGPNSYRNQLLTAYNQPIVAPPPSAVVCAPGDPTAVCDAKILQFCQNNNQPANVNACVSSLSNNVYGTGGQNPTTPGPMVRSGIFSITWNNPLSVNTLDELIIAILNILTIIAIPIITLFIIYAGFLYVTARGNAEQVRTATTALTFAIIGAILIIGAVAVTTIMQGTITQFTGP